MSEFGESSVTGALAGLAAPGEPAAAGAASALACAIAAALVELTAGLAATRLGAEGNRVGAAEAERLRELAARAAEVRARMPSLAEEDAGIYAEVGAAHGAEERAAALSRAADPPLEVAEAAAEMAHSAAAVIAAGAWPFTADAVVAAEISAAAARSGAELVIANLGAGSDDARVTRARAAAERAAAPTGG